MSAASSSSSLIGGKTVAQWLAEIKAGKLQANGAKPRQAFRNGIVQARVHSERDRFIASISDDNVLRLAQSYHNGDTCAFFKPPVRGSYNICYFVHFPSTSKEGQDGDKWVVRIPLDPCLAHGPKSKLESEVATMQLIAEKTTIPIPQIYAYALGNGPDPFPSFLILGYVEGQKLTTAVKTLPDERRNRLYASLADIYIQLRRLEFPSIGRLKRGQDGCGYQVRERINTIDLNMQELEGLAPSEVQELYYGPGGRILSSANASIEMLLEIAYRAFTRGPGASSEEEGADTLYHLHMFRQYAEDVWLDHDLNNGPFILVHGDLETFNLLLDDDLNIVSVLDWEWSRVVPRQFFIPPLWLSNTSIEDMSYSYRYNDYLELFNEFLAVVRIRERQRYGNELLADEWDKAKQKSGFLVANALENWTAMDWFANRYINFRIYGGKSDLEERVAAFTKSDPAREELVKKMVRRWNAYTAELEHLKADSENCKFTKSAVAAPRPDKKHPSTLVVQDLISWVKGISTISLTQPLPLAMSALIVLSVGGLYLSRRRMR